MKTNILIPLLLALGCTDKNPIRGLLSPSDGAALDVASPLGGNPRHMEQDGSTEEPDMPRGRPGDVTQPLAPDADEADLAHLVEIDASSGEPDALVAETPDAVVAEPDAAITEPDAAAWCQGDEDCPGGSCTPEGVCGEFVCRRDADCPEGSCDPDGACAGPRCARHADCQAGSTCPAGVCIESLSSEEGCTSNSCPAGQGCQEETGLCLPECEAPGWACPVALPFCLPGAAPFWNPTCVECLGDISCAPGISCDTYFCNDGR